MAEAETRDTPSSAYPPIADYAFISDCHSAALVSASGSIDWCCMPRLDSPSCFGRLLGWESGGYCRIWPTGQVRSTRRYLEGTLILETTCTSEGGSARILDFFPMRRGGRHQPFKQILRIIEGLRGEMEFSLDCQPRLDYGSIKPWIREQDGSFLIMGGSTGLLLSGDYCFEPRGRHDLAGTCSVRRGERRHLSLLFSRPEDLDDGQVEVPAVGELDRRLEQTRVWWQTWADQFAYSGPYRDLVLRSAIVLKGLSNAPSGAIAAAATTSLPEAPGGERNWDYRFSWIRDSYFSVRSLSELGFVAEADGFRRFIERSCAGSAEELQILYGIGGERRLHEYELPDLNGYGGARPVRIGNAAESQLQLDVYGELLDLAWNWHRRGHSPDDDYWEFLVELVGAAAEKWRQPDRGVWEMRCAPRHFVLSKAMCWVALDRGIRLAEELARAAPVEKWRQARTEVREWVETQGYDDARGVFTQAAGFREMDASLLLLPIIGFIDPGDARMRRTVAAIREDLEKQGLLLRYPGEGDGLAGREGRFLACSFWLAECLALQGEEKSAREVFERAAATGNELGLFAEEWEGTSGTMLGNFPQGLSHLSLIAAAVTLGGRNGQKGGECPGRRACGSD